MKSEAETCKNPIVYEALSCEHASTGPINAELQCALGKKIKVEAAAYGRTDKTHCPSSEDIICDETIDHTGAVAAACDGKESCSYHGTNELGDPCKGTEKYTKIQYTCDSTADKTNDAQQNLSEWSNWSACSCEGSSLKTSVDCKIDLIKAENPSQDRSL